MGTSASARGDPHVGKVPSLAVVSQLDLEPAGAVVSLHRFEGRDVRNAFCRDVNFFASEQAAPEWLHAHPGAWVLPVAQAHSLAQELARQLAYGAASTCC